MSKLLHCAALVAGSVLVTAAAADDRGGKAFKLEGGYTIVAGEENGKEVPADYFKGSVVRFVGNTITGSGKDKKEFFGATYTLDTSRTPHVIRMKSSAPKVADATGLVKKEGDAVVLIYALPGSPAPTEFKTKQGQLMFTLRPLRKDGKK